MLYSAYGYPKTAGACKVTMSDIVGPEDPTRLMWELSLGEFLDSVARRNPDKVFVEMGGERGYLWEVP